MGKIAKIIGGIFKPKMPEVPSFRMPDPDSFAAGREALKKVRERGKKSGREGTIYTGATAPPYSGTNLGGTS